MSDNERMADGEDVGLPRATVNKLIQEYLPADVMCAKDTKDLVAECCKEFITLISSEANEICEKEAKKTISPEHITSALKQLGFDDYIEEVESVNQVHKAQAKHDNQKRKNKLDQSGLSQDELAAQQELLFAASKARFDAGQT
ncbi:hypothetical protein CROQUDRAFT_651448 [Cronartium quercuum f. sp. fusiforme G11]|uniref:Transcription factor CBF/NF-Y/archaeal histone domain-containing protein n=1 Tax=Cronartium quercuum f. sp. fusiforme G11 TaxID=708437 RepID=A0A9P6NVM8_9BASI|nr:hypothetical protein CROQUDRAFT_651448 [Cronartium quercuum f. sp. fusiforme G11]